jgi:predicted acetyltransferase
MAETPNQGQIALGTFQDGELVLEFLKVAPHEVHKVPTYFSRMIQGQFGKELGAINVRVGSNPLIERYAGHVGYVVHPAHRGHHYASRSLRLLMPLARALQLNPLWITCDPENIASRRSCELAGAQFVGVVAVPDTCIIHRNGHPQKCRYRLDVSNVP